MPMTNHGLDDFDPGPLPSHDPADLGDADGLDPQRLAQITDDITELAQVIIDVVPGEPSRPDEGAIACAARLLRDLHGTPPASPSPQHPDDSPSMAAARQANLEDELATVGIQIAAIADLIMNEIPGEPSGIETTLEGALRLLRKAYVVGEMPSFPARPTDPGTSDQAANRKQSHDVARFSDRSQCAKLLRLIADKPRTAYGAAVMLPDSGTSVSRLEGTRRRVSDLVRAGYVVDSGKRRRNPGSPDESIVWEVSPKGRIALDRLDETGWSK